MNILIDTDAHPVIAHRGNSAYAPENTLVSFGQAVTLGADALEFDVRLTRDGVPVVIHDATVDRTTNGTGRVADMTLADLRQLDAGARFTTDGGRNYEYAGHGHAVPTLEEMLVSFAEIPLLIEVKIAEAVEPTRRLLEGYAAGGRTLVASSSRDAVWPFRRPPGKLPTGASLVEVMAMLQRAVLPLRSGALPFEALCIPDRYYGVPLPMGRISTVARRSSVATHVWTVNDPALARRLWLRGVQGIVTDDPRAMLGLRRALFGY